MSELVQPFFECRTKVKVLTDEAKAKIKELNSPNELPNKAGFHYIAHYLYSSETCHLQERRMWYNAMERRMNNPVGLPEGLVAKYHSPAGAHGKKAPWMYQPDVD